MARHLCDPAPTLSAALLSRATAPDDPWCRILVAEEERADPGPMLGFLVFSRRFEAHCGDFSFWIADLHVAASARRRGVGRALLRAVAAEARDAGCTSLAWDLWKENVLARAFYRSLGAEVDHELEVLRIPTQRLLRE